MGRFPARQYWFACFTNANSASHPRVQWIPIHRHVMGFVTLWLVPR
jgi:hypothetical protein